MTERPEIVYCNECSAQIITASDWLAYDDADLCANCYQNAGN